MKGILLSIMLLVGINFVYGQKLNKQSRKERREALEAQRIEEVKTLINDKTWIFKVNTAVPLAGPAISVNGSFDVELVNDTVVSYLPFFGIGYLGDIGKNEGPFDFTKPIKNYSFKKEKKVYRIKFEVINEKDYLTFFFDIGITGSTTLSINSRNRQTMSFYGIIESIK